MADRFILRPPELTTISVFYKIKAVENCCSEIASRRLFLLTRGRQAANCYFLYIGFEGATGGGAAAGEMA
jgi:hypothetical protein